MENEFGEIGKFSTTSILLDFPMVSSGLWVDFYARGWRSSSQKEERFRASPITLLLLLIQTFVTFWSSFLCPVVCNLCVLQVLQM